MEEQQQAELQQQQQHRGAGGRGGRGGAGAAAQGPHHGGCLTRNGAPPAGNPSHPRRGAAATTSAVATPASSLASAPSPGIRGGREGWVEREKGRGTAKADWRAAPLATGVERGGVRPGRSGRAGGEPGSRGGASLRDAVRRKQRSPRWGLPGGCRAQAPGGGGTVLPEPTPPSPAQPPAANGAVLRDEQNRARGLGAADSSRHSSRDDSTRGRRGRRGVCEAGDPIAPTRAGEERECPGSRVPRRSGLRARRAAAGSPSAGAHHKLGGPAPHLLTPARGEPRGGRRKRSRRPLLPPPPPPLPEPGAPAGEGGEVVPGDFSWPPASPGGQREHGVG